MLSKALFMRRILFVVFFALLSLTAFAQENKSKGLEIVGPDGNHSFVLNDICSVKYQEDKMLLAFSDGQEALFDISGIGSMRFVTVESTGIKKTGNSVIFDGKGIVVNGNGVCNVSIYTTAGALVGKLKCEVGEYIDLSSYTQGLLIINIDGTNYKIEKR